MLPNVGYIQQFNTVFKWLIAPNFHAVTGKKRTGKKHIGKKRTGKKRICI